jgi:lysozyme
MTLSNGSVTLAELSAALIAPLEGCRLTSYADSGGVLTIGIGHTGPDVHVGMTITQTQAEALFAADQSHLLAMVDDRPLLEAAALVSFGFNCGSGALSRVIAGLAHPEDFIHDAKGNVLPGLVTRRHLEATLMLVSQQMER